MFLNENEQFIYDKTLNAPFEVSVRDIYERLERYGVIKADNTPNNLIIGCIARTYAVTFTDNIMYDFDNNINMLFIYRVLNGLWEKKEIHGMYFYLTSCSEIYLKYVPRELFLISNREDLLLLYMKHFISEYRKIVFCEETEDGLDD